MIKQLEIQLPEFHRGIHLITPIIERYLTDLPESGLLNIFIKHTSAGLTLNENYDPSVRDDMETILDKLAPENSRDYSHTTEGQDDMPAHFKSTVVGHSVTIPVTNGKLNFGTWQGIYLCEFRNRGGRRRIVLTVTG
jgi:secondary thiamine-phosphate synthase enzyme